MNKLLDLLVQAKWSLASEEELNLYNSRPSPLLQNINKSIKDQHDFNLTSIGEYFSDTAKTLWFNEEEQCIEMLSDYIGTGKDCPESIIIGFIAAWSYSEIQHPILDKLAKHTLRCNLLKYPLNTTVAKYLVEAKKKVAHRPKKDVLHYLDTLMTYFEVKTINKTGNMLCIDNKTVRDRLRKLVGDNSYEILIDESFIYFKDIQRIYNMWIKYKNN